MSVLFGPLFLLACQFPQVSFNNEIRPLLNQKCVSCHGGVKKGGGLNLLFRHTAVEPAESGKPAIVPGDPSASELVHRIRHTDPAARMPKKSDPLTPGEIRLIEAWIDQGAAWEEHWAYRPVKELEPPELASRWPRNEIDRFVLARLIQEGLKPSPEASATDLIRRVSLDLTGLPPSPEEVAAFVSDPSTDAYEKLVDRLLASPRYGERWASMWLDLARYADTKGYERDPGRNIWLYRDWLIRAFNRDLPFDQFTIVQLAGDLLPSPTQDQYIATAFHRNTMNNDEGGTDNEEYRIAAVIDRVNTTWEVWQGTTFSCAQCHGHPYDPFTHTEYYRALAFFNNTRDEDTPSESPVYRVYEPQQIKEIQQIGEWVFRFTEGNDSEKEHRARQISDLLRFAEPKIHPHNFEILHSGTHADTKYLVMYREGEARISGVPLQGETQLLVMMNWAKNNTRIRVLLDRPDGSEVARLDLDDNDKGILQFDLKPHKGTRDLYFHFDNPDMEKKQGTCQISWILLFQGLPGRSEPGFQVTQKNLLDLLNAKVDEVPIMIENPVGFRRKTYVFDRGNWLTPGDEVDPGVPSSLRPLEEGPPRNRLGLARWIVSHQNPLTARVTVNRFWEQLFGIGLVETTEDFGTQGTRPSHPELLDWMAYEFMHGYDWSIKRLIRQIVTSATYRQSAVSKSEILERDPRNRLLARGPRMRLSAEQIRDAALAVSGLLSGQMFGPSVMPYQPKGVWQVIYNDQKWTTSAGEDKYRRALYTYWRRTSPYPSMVAFDAPSRELCVSRRLRTNTPLQALVTLNDPVFVEAARSLARRMFEEGGTQLSDQLRRGVNLALVRDPDPEMLTVLTELYENAHAKFLKDVDLAVDLAADDKNSIEIAGLTVVANVILNLDEFVTK